MSSGGGSIRAFPFAAVHLSLLPPLRRLLSGTAPLPPARTDPVDAREARRDFRLLAAGLHVVLSRHPRHVVQRDFRVAAFALRSLRRQFGAVFVTVSLPAATLNDLGHEIALHADLETRDTVARCLRRAVSARRAAALHA